MNSALYGDLANWSAAHLQDFLFYLLAFMAVPLAYGVIFDRRIIRCGFLLIGVFGTISGIFLLLQAQFLAMAQLMIYAVGITLVVVIALMLTNPRLEQDALIDHRRLPAVVSFVVFVVIYLGLRSETWQLSVRQPTLPEANVTKIGLQLLGYYSIPFEFASVLLLIALVGAIMLAKADRPSEPETWIDDHGEDAEERSAGNVVKV